MTVDTVGDALKIRAPGFSFLKGDPLARLKDGRSVRVELAAMVLPGPGKSPAATTRRIFALSYDLWEERFAVTHGGRALAVRLAPDAGRRRGVVRRAAGHAGQRAWRAGPRPAVLDSARVPRRWTATARRIRTDSGYTLQALIDALSRRRQDRVVAARARGRSVPAAGARLVLAAMTDFAIA